MQISLASKTKIIFLYSQLWLFSFNDSDIEFFKSAEAIIRAVLL